jgi:hypothetical protein
MQGHIVGTNIPGNRKLFYFNIARSGARKGVIAKAYR